MDVRELRKDFPILEEKVNNNKLIYFDNAATTQKPLSVINAVSDYYGHSNANVHRGVHTLSQIATEQFEKVREQVRNFINADSSCEIIYTRGTTESINLLAYSLTREFTSEDEVLLSESEHHSNIVPWQIAAMDKGFKIKVIPLNEDGSLNLSFMDGLLTDRTRIVSVAHVSNSLGVVNDIKTVFEKARQKGAKDIKTIVDGAQGIPHMKIDVKSLDCDFYCFSAHKIYAPMGIGVLYGRKSVLEQMSPYQGGGEMIKEVTFAKTTFNQLPYKFEAGTPSVADVVGFGAAMDYVSAIGFEWIAKHEDDILHYALDGLNSLEGVRVIGSCPQKAGAISFLVDNAHPFDVGTLLDQMGIAVRTGHHCAQPVMSHYGITGTVRASFALYNTREEVEVFISSLKKVISMLQ
ncbi:MAG TPA: cysteine desulfurase [Candidatus Onthomorpha intestinigallinarum]|uniref:Cysteine desulfurase n=1 Tax=Candidatus Onthomorpha intestinigallinarum TaxID=2840880 RepID=A0A9D1UHM2_9BACT|nr:cysteine desulfurase [Candidatus Onthomorpha intestinigallinarum]